MHLLPPLELRAGIIRVSRAATNPLEPSEVVRVGARVIRLRARFRIRVRVRVRVSASESVAAGRH